MKFFFKAENLYLFRFRASEAGREYFLVVVDCCCLSDEVCEVCDSNEVKQEEMAVEDEMKSLLTKLNEEETGEERSDSTPSSSEDELETSLEKADDFRW